MSKGKMDATQQRVSTSSRPDSDCMELVWENGQIMMQGHSSKVRNSPISNNVQTLAPNPQDGKNANDSKMAKFTTMDSVLTDLPLPVHSSEMGLDQDVDMVPWLNYPMEDPWHNDYTSDFVSELSGVTINDLSTANHLASREKKSNFSGDSYRSALDNVMSSKHGNTSKASSSRGGTSEVPQFSLPFKHNVPRSGICDISGSSTGNAHHVASRGIIDNPSSPCAFANLRSRKLDAEQPSTGSGFTNFSFFSRPVSLVRADQSTINSSKRFENDDKRCTLSSSNPPDSTLVNLDSDCSQMGIVSHNQSFPGPISGNSEFLPSKPNEELFPTSQAICRKDVSTNDALHNQVYDATMTKVGTADEKNMEPIVATSSVCSGNSVERASNEPIHDLKRKSRETGESEGPSEDNEEESVGARKKTSSRKSSKRSRAAEVHNLSERRRRDRINEKMRALQELVPNCNKVDKASMLDEAIEYLKTLQLQVQMLSMGTGMYMQPMMLPPGMQPIHGPMPHFSPMGVGMGMGMGVGMGMGYGMNMPFQGPHYPGPGPTFHGMPSSSLQAFGNPGQGLSMSMPRAPVLPVSASVPGSTDLAPSSSSKDIGPQVMPRNNVNNVNRSINQASNQNRSINQASNQET